MKTRGIIFSGPMVMAILESRKVQTRRVVRDHPKGHDPRHIAGTTWEWWNVDDKGEGFKIYRRCPFGTIGDHLYVREAMIVGEHPQGNGLTYHYKADGAKSCMVAQHPMGKTIPSIYMRRGCSRIMLEVTNIRVEQIKAISDEDCEAEGVCPSEDGDASDWLADESGWRRTFRQTWDALNKKRGYGWEKNPWCWTLTFKEILPSLPSSY